MRVSSRKTQKSTSNIIVWEAEGTPEKLATGAEPKLPRNVTDCKHAAGFKISRRTLRKLMFD
jgi:hypothetical protein